MEHIFKPGDICLECQQLGLPKRLRHFWISLEEQIIKCENDNCLYPYTDEDSTGSDKNIRKENLETANVSLFNEMPNFDGVLDELLNVNTATTTETATTNDTITLHHYDVYDMQAALPQNSSSNLVFGVNENLKRIPSSIDVKPKIKIQSIETIKTDFIKKEKEYQVERLKPMAPDSIPKACITRYKAATAMHNQKVKRQRVANSPRHVKKIKIESSKKEKNHKSTLAGCSATLDDVLKLVKINKNPFD